MRRNHLDPRIGALAILSLLFAGCLNAADQRSDTASRPIASKPPGWELGHEINWTIEAGAIEAGWGANLNSSAIDFRFDVPPDAAAFRESATWTCTAGPNCRIILYNVYAQNVYQNLTHGDSGELTITEHEPPAGSWSFGVFADDGSLFVGAQGTLRLEFTRKPVADVPNHPMNWTVVQELEWKIDVGISAQGSVINYNPTTPNSFRYTIPGDVAAFRETATWTCQTGICRITMLTIYDTNNYANWADGSSGSLNLTEKRPPPGEWEFGVSSSAYGAAFVNATGTLRLEILR